MFCNPGKVVTNSAFLVAANSCLNLLKRRCNEDTGGLSEKLKAVVLAWGNDALLALLGVNFVSQNGML